MDLRQCGDSSRQTASGKIEEPYGQKTIDKGEITINGIIRKSKL